MYLSDLALHSNMHTQEINKVKTEIKNRTSESAICEMLLIICDQIALDSEIVKLAKEKPPNNQAAQVKRNAIDLGRRLSLMAEAINHSFSRQKDLQKRLAKVEKQYPQKLQLQGQDLKSSITLLQQETRETLRDLTNTVQQNELTAGEQLQKAKDQLKEAIQDLRPLINKKVQQNQVIQKCKQTADALKRQFGVYEGLKSVDPAEFKRFVQEQDRRYQQLRLKDLDNAFDIKKTKQHIQNQLIQKSFFQVEKKLAEQRLNDLFGRFEEVGRICFKNEVQMEQCVRLCGSMDKLTSSLGGQVKRTSGIVDSLHLGDNFREVIDSLQPKKILAFQSNMLDLAHRLGQTESQLGTAVKELSRTTRQLHQLQVLFKAKTEQLDPQVIQPMLLKLLKKNYFMRMLQNHEVIISNLERDNKKVEQLEKKLIVLERQTADPKILLMMKSLEQYFRKTVMQNQKRVLTLQNIIREVWNEAKTKKHFVIESVITDQSFVKFKQLAPQPGNLILKKQQFLKKFQSQKTHTQSRSELQMRPKTQSIKRLPKY